MKFLRTLAVGYLHFPHVALMRLIGPRPAVILSRLGAWLHWLLTFVGAERHTRTVMQATQHEWAPHQSVRHALRRYLELKHQNFAEWYVYATTRGRRYVDQTYKTMQGREHLDAALAEGRGAILLVFHFGFAKMAFPGLKSLGYDVHVHLSRGSTYSNYTHEWMAQAAMRRLAEMDAQSGLKLIYHRPLTALVTMTRVLRRGGMVAMNADGMQSDDLLEVPFLGGSVQLPTGPAQLSAQTGAPIVPLFVLPEGLFGHRIILHPQLQPSGTSRTAVERIVRDYAAILDRYVRADPWAWWTWRRLRMQRLADGTTQFEIRALTGEESKFVYRPADVS